MAAAGLTVTYGGLALLGLSPPNTIHQITVALERLMEEDAEAGRPFHCRARTQQGPRRVAGSGLWQRAVSRQVHRRSQWSGGSIFFTQPN
jgi:hypothetical protein